MKLIAHRGNTNGPTRWENEPSYIVDSIKKGFDVEIDVWYVNNEYFLGHDEPIYKIKKDFLYQEQLWCHAKNPGALQEMNNADIHCFWHQNDDYTITSKGFIWSFPNAAYIANMVVNQPEIYTDLIEFNTNVFAVCSDYVDLLKILDNKHE